jgi:hypothetical protein
MQFHKPLLNLTNVGQNVKQMLFYTDVPLKLSRFRPNSLLFYLNFHIYIYNNKFILTVYINLIDLSMSRDDILRSKHIMDNKK